MISAGGLNKRISLLQNVKIPDGMGGFKTTIVTVATVWAKFKKPNVSTVVINGAIASEMLREIEIRYRKDIQKGWFVGYQYKTFSVEHTYDLDKETTVLVVKEVVK